MKKITKKALGLVGLATVAALTIVAAGINTPANAVESSSVDVEVTVLDSGETNVTIISPKNDGKTANPVVPVEIVYGKASKAKYSLTYTDEQGQSITIPLGEEDTPEYDGGVLKTEFNLKDYDLGYGTYILNIEVTGNGSASDSVEFTYKPVIVEPAEGGQSTVNPDGTATTSESGELDVNIYTSPEEEPGYGEVYIYDSNGNRVVNPATGEPISIHISPEDIASGYVSLNLADYGLANGQKYKVEFNVFDASGTLIGSDYIFVFYEVSSADVPNTGGSLTAMMNFSNSDFLISSLIVFSAVTIGAIILVKKSSRR